MNLVAINPQTSREACLKTVSFVDMIGDNRLEQEFNKLLADD